MLRQLLGSLYFYSSVPHILLIRADIHTLFLDAFHVTNRKTLSFGEALLTAEIVPPQIPSGKAVEGKL